MRNTQKKLKDILYIKCNQKLFIIGLIYYAEIFYIKNDFIIRVIYEVFYNKIN